MSCGLSQPACGAGPTRQTLLGWLQYSTRVARGRRRGYRGLTAIIGSTRAAALHQSMNSLRAEAVRSGAEPR